jgi:hypothetical protein
MTTNPTTPDADDADDFTDFRDDGASQANLEFITMLVATSKRGGFVELQLDNGQAHFGRVREIVNGVLTLENVDESTDRYLSTAWVRVAAISAILPRPAWSDDE